MLELLTAFGKINNMEDCINTIRQHAVLPEDITDAAICQQINYYTEQAGKSVKEFRDSNYNEINSEKNAEYMLIFSGYYTEAGAGVYIQFSKGNSGWNGAYIGTYTSLRTKFIKAGNKKKSNANTDELDQQFLEYIYKRTLHKNGWSKEKNDLAYLKEYLLFYKRFFEHNLEKEQSNNETRIRGKYIFNKDKTKVLFSLNLFDVYVHEIRVVCSYREKKLTYLFIVESKERLIELGFAYEDIKRLPVGVKFYNNLSELVMEIDDISDYDFENSTSIKHVIEQRIFRFPEQYRELSLDYLATQLQKSLEYSTEMIKKDYKYAVPMYSVTNDCIQFLIPYYVQNSYLDKPEMALIVTKKLFWEVKTIVPMETAYTNSRIISLQNNSWVSLKDTEE